MVDSARRQVGVVVKVRVLSRTGSIGAVVTSRSYVDFPTFAFLHGTSCFVFSSSPRIADSTKYSTVGSTVEYVLQCTIQNASTPPTCLRNSQNENRASSSIGHIDLHFFFQASVVQADTTTQQANDHDQARRLFNIPLPAALSLSPRSLSQFLLLIKTDDHIKRSTMNALARTTLSSVPR